MRSSLDLLSPRQQALLHRWLPGATIERDHSWGLVETTVLQLKCANARFIVKAGGENDRGIVRELHAHRHWLTPLTRIGRAPTLEHGDAEAKLLVTRFLPGELMQDSPQAEDPASYRQAGELLALLHAQQVNTDDGYEQWENDRALAWLAGAHRIEAGTVQRLREMIASWPTPPAALVPTHGDWQPRNWLIHHRLVHVIDFGRAALRPALTDFARLAVQQFRRDPRLEAAFLAGYGHDPRETQAWARCLVREAIGTAAWAYRVGDERFEAQGHRMISEVL